MSRTPIDPSQYYLIPRRAVKRLLVFLVLCLTLLYAFRTSWLPGIGTYLVHTEPPRQADAIIVLGGGGSGDRELTGARLFHEGYAPQLYTTGSKVGLSGLEEITWAFLSRRELMELGVPGANITRLENSGSTCTEAVETHAILKADGVETILLVTDPFHTFRAARLFENTFEDSDITIVPIAADPSWFVAELWWTNPVGLNAVASEYMKLAYFFFVGCWE